LYQTVFFSRDTKQQEFRRVPEGIGGNAPNTVAISQSGLNFGAILGDAYTRWRDARCHPGGGDVIG
jgi:hypothetical protein